MKARWQVWLGVLCTTAGLMSVAVTYGEEPAKSAATKADGEAPQRQLDPESDDDKGLSIEAARDRAQVMHDIYAATLEVLHHRYFHRDRAIIPARAMQDIFSEITRQSRVEARWISASMKPMSVDHAPQGDFEEKAAKEIAAGKEQLEVVEDGYYRRAGAIPLGDGCVGCHGGFFRPPSKTPQFAGLVISVPIKKGGAPSLQSTSEKVPAAAGTSEE